MIQVLREEKDWTANELRLVIEQSHRLRVSKTVMNHQEKKGSSALHWAIISKH